MSASSYREDFLSLLRSGLWEQPARLSGKEDAVSDGVLRLAEEQTVVGLVAAGLEYVKGTKVSKQQALPYVKQIYAIESRNADMNRFVAELFSKLRDAGIFAVLVKGQGIAQCYERPRWRSAGDVDLLLDAENYEKAKSLLTADASRVEKERNFDKHLGMTIDSWSVELHGSMRSYQLGRVNACIDEVQDDIFRQGRTRIWKNGETEVALPAVDEDVILVFTHILQHFFSVGIGLRQICDLCRLLWTYRDEIDRDLLGKRLDAVRLRSEWEVLASLAVNYLGMPAEAMPLYRKTSALDRKATRLMNHILRTGNFGHNRDSGYMRTNPYLVRKLISFGKNTRGAFFRLMIFPLDTVSFYVRDIVYSLKAVGRGE